jgi:hypothetical protein
MAMRPALRLAMAALRWALALAIAMYIFRGLMAAMLSPFGALALIPWQFGVNDERVLIACSTLVLALVSAVAIGAGIVVAPHRHWKLATGLLSIALVLPMAALFVQDTVVSGDSSFDVTDLAILTSVAAGGVLVYGVLRWLWRARIDPAAVPMRASSAILIAFACFLLLPVGTVTVPAWRLKLVDAREQPLANLDVRQSWIDFSIDAQSADPDEESRATDAEGVVAFPARVRWSSLAVRLWRPVETDLSSFRHRRDGRYTRLAPLCPLRSLESRGVMDYRDTSLPGRLHLVEDDGPRGNIDPSCAHLLDQVRSAQTPR